MNRASLDSLLKGKRHEKRDWDWWSWFLARHYFGSSSESPHWDAAARAIVSDAGLEPGIRVLDLGSGCGELEFRLAQRGMDVLGIDNSELLVRDSIKIAANRGIPARFERRDMFTFSTDTLFDAVICINTSFGYGNDEEHGSFFGKVAEWLKPEGKFYLDLIVADNARSFGIWSDYLEDGTLVVDNSYDPKGQYMSSLPYWITPDETSVYSADVPERVKLYTIAEIEEMFDRAGLTARPLRSGPGRKTRETGPNMTQTWIARKREE